MRGIRPIGRILSLGFPLPGVRVDNYNFFSAPSFFDYDAVVVDPAALGHLIEAVVAGSEDERAFNGDRVRNESAAPGQASLGELLERRRDEVALLLGNGGAVICFAWPATTHAAVRGTGLLDDYYWMPDSVSSACRAPALEAADGTETYVIDYEHPLASFVAGQAANVAYRARFETALIRNARVFAKSRRGAAVAVDLPLESGHLVMLPALAAVPSGDARYAMSDALQAGIRRLLGVTGEGREPAWTGAFGIPGLEARAAELAEARAASIDAEQALAAAQARYDELARFRRLLWQEGRLGLDEVVLDALRTIGFDVYDRDPAAVELRAGGDQLLLEIESSDRAIDLAPHYRLRQRVERIIEQRATAPRGLLVVNGERSVRPQDRAYEVSDSLRAASETMRYCIAPARTLFDAVVAQMTGDAERVAAYRRTLFSHDGVLAVDGDPDVT
jgi:hypothetical protein